MQFRDKTVFITGASRGIGKEIALKLASEGANIVIAAKSVTEDPRLGGTIYSAAAEVEKAGGQALAVQVDIRNEEQVMAAVAQAAERFGGIDILINNASAIQLSGTEKTDPRRFDLMFDINVRGTFLMTRSCIPHLKKASNPHILTLSPPVNLQPKWLAPHVAYTLTKYNMSMMALGWADEFRNDGIASNALWPRTTIATAAVKNLLGGEELMQKSRTPAIVADAAAAILSKTNLLYTGRTWIDEEVLAAEGITSFTQYAVDPDAELFPDLFI
ncbi:SDR family oxidoreductase [Filimonas effusa]|uniref:NAD(P)-dependent oxidoreductase n=1 Tax=Filimonas effusa TaxID=2508721 RepID=A0A4Q1D1K2_9BACT|nr:NAD(P)-dependent oxidoreductase [Filimonas effusa]RXK80885.1 NAD(P)-dependent oxidoreductase [Filimonas effusa]